MNRNECIDMYKEELVKWRRDFHMHPETGFEELRTSRRIVEILQTFDVEIISNFCKTAVIAVVKGDKPGPVIGIRADMDALPLVDQKQVEYKSQNPGACHACGHDVHVTVALGLIKYYASHKDELCGTLKVVFQPAEEGPAPGGAKLIVDSGKVDDIDIMLGYHTNPDHPVGTLLLRRNEMLASADNFNIIIKGTGGHGAYPHQIKDALMVGVEAYNAFQNLLTREVDPVKPAVLSICSFNAGTPKGTNVIPPSISMSGTVRTFDNDIRDYIIKRMKEILDAICEMNGCTNELSMATVSIALSNNDDLVDVFEDAGIEVLGEENVSYMKVPEMGYDDFAYFGLKSKAAYFYFGTTNPDDLGKFTFHQPTFDVDENCLCTGIKILVRILDKITNMED
ncbi:amidohydrolase [Sedimentibacter sp. zth1]|uniref:M20 metallopeptidase family protein n=1 Tax=Sedimentibacter sp. zth1 TaxID=2816908 RepID=UPI001A917A85|nr:M20 family metallopeptidase [Sedimentibacter sp. zth1]QSX05539.1 amidohydrolase [Sedimentibacter sp. zth1]